MHVIIKCIIILTFFTSVYEQSSHDRDDVDIFNAYAVDCVIDQILRTWSADTLPTHSGVVNTLVEDSCRTDRTVGVVLMVNIDDGFIDTGGFYFN